MFRRSRSTWHEEEARFAFQNGDAAFMRNWPYPYAFMNDSASSRVAGRYAVAPMPAAAGGRPTAALGGAQLAINAFSPHPDAAWAVVEYLTRPEQMLERARVVGQFPTRPALYRRSPARPGARGAGRSGARGGGARRAAAGDSGLHPALGDSSGAAAPGADATDRARDGARSTAARAMQELLDRAGLGQGGRVAAR